MAYRIPGNPSYDYPKDDNDKLDLMFQILYKFKSTYTLIPRIAEYLDWNIKLDMREIELKLLLDKSPYLLSQRLSSDRKGYKLNDEAAFGIHKYGSYKAWQLIENPQPE